MATFSNGLSADTNCPECGSPVAESIEPGRRVPTIWERDPQQRGRLIRFLSTTAQVILHPRAFYRALETRSADPAAHTFAMIHWLLAAAMFAVAAVAHQRWVAGSREPFGPAPLWLAGAGIGIATFGMLAFTTRLASRLSTWEGTMRGYRLPGPVVRRALYYHAAHYLPVAALACAVAVANALLSERGVLTYKFVPTYLFILCGGVIVAAGYLFQTYWTGMRSIMYANF